MNHPFFSVIIPTYNRADTVGRSIESVLNQSFHDFEIIVVDDGSEDNSRQFMERSYYHKVKYVYQDNKGVCAARNHGAALANGRFLIFLDSDDWLGDNTLHAFHNALEHGTAKLVLGSMRWYDAAGKIVKERLPERRGAYYTQGLTGSFAILKSFFFGIGGYDENLFYSENTDLFWRIQFNKDTDLSTYTVCKNGGVCIVKEERSVRKARYSEKKYLSVKYFMGKHENYLNNNLRHFKNFKRILAISALQNNHVGEARLCFKDVLMKTPFSLRSHLNYYFVLLMPRLARLYYGR